MFFHFFSSLICVMKLNYNYLHYIFIYKKSDYFKIFKKIQVFYIYIILIKK